MHTMSSIPSDNVASLVLVDFSSCVCSRKSPLLLINLSIHVTKLPQYLKLSRRCRARCKLSPSHGADFGDDLSSTKKDAFGTSRAGNNNWCDAYEHNRR